MTGIPGLTLLDADREVSADPRHSRTPGALTAVLVRSPRAASAVADAGSRRTFPALASGSSERASAPRRPFEWPVGRRDVIAPISPPDTGLRARSNATLRVDPRLMTERRMRPHAGLRCRAALLASRAGLARRARRDPTRRRLRLLRAPRALRPDRRADPEEVYRVDGDGLRASNALLAWLDGPMVDDGTATEIGVFAELVRSGDPRYRGIVGLVTDLRLQRRRGNAVGDGMNLFVAAQSPPPAASAGRSRRQSRRCTSSPDAEAGRVSRVELFRFPSSLLHRLVATH